MSGPAPTSARMILTLALAGTISGATLVGAYHVTRPIIERNQAEALRAAIYRVVPGAGRHEARMPDGDRLAPAGPQAEAVLYAAYDAAGALVGYAIPGEGGGFQDTIRLIFGFDPHTRRIVGMEVLDSRETPGLGDKIVKDRAFLAQFQALAVEPGIVVTKPGERAAANEVDAISGATISSKAVVAILNETVARWRPWLDAPATTTTVADTP